VKGFITRHRKILAVVIAATFIAPVILTGTRVFGTNPSALRQAGEQELTIASNISNLTGVPSEKILDMWIEKFSWNEILERLKDGKFAEVDREDMDRLLAAEGLGENVVDTLLGMGFDRDEITGVKLLVERVLFNLEEITAFGDNDEYRDLKSLIDIDRAVYYMLVLQDDFGDMHKVLDEYLLALQVGLDLGMYIEDAKKYEEEKLQKIALGNIQVITCGMIEEKMLETVRSRADINSEREFSHEHMNDGPVDPDGEIPETPGIMSELSGTMSGLPETMPELPEAIPGLHEISPELPEIVNSKPVNPAQRLMDEIRLINPMQ
jgi:hypothetical protein